MWPATENRLKSLSTHPVARRLGRIAILVFAKKSEHVPPVDYDGVLPERAARLLGLLRTLRLYDAMMTGALVVI
jgi:hypothetical protein